MSSKLSESWARRRRRSLFTKDARLSSRCRWSGRLDGNQRQMSSTLLNDDADGEDSGWAVWEEVDEAVVRLDL